MPSDIQYQRAFDPLCAEDGTALYEFETLATAHPRDALVQLHLSRLRSRQRGDLLQRGTMHSGQVIA